MRPERLGWVVGLCCALLLSSAAVAQEEPAAEGEGEGEGATEGLVQVQCTTDEQLVAEALRRAQRYLRALPPLKTRFVQRDAASGALRHGRLVLSPPYRLRLDYDPPSGLRLYVNAQKTLHVDTEKEIMREYPLFTLPAVRILQRIFSGKDSKTIEATQVCLIEDRIERVRVRLKKQRRRGDADLYFAIEPQRFLGWDLRGTRLIEIRLGRLIAIARPKITFFRYKAPWLEEP